MGCFKIHCNFFILCALAIITFFPNVESIKLCNKPSDYFFHSKSCVENFDNERNITEIIRGWGFTAEEYHLTTGDGYKLLLSRGYKGKKAPNATYPIVLGHGVHMNSRGWCMLTNNSLAHQLISEGYDVWLTNYRGTMYSLGHVELSHKERAYWDYSFDEMGKYDLPKKLEIVHSKTQKKAIYIGYSMGTSIGFVYTSSMPTHSQKHVKNMIYLAPVAYMRHARSLAISFKPYTFWLRLTMTYLLGGKVYVPEFVKGLCAFSPVTIYICETVKMFFVGFDFGQFDWKHLPITEYLNPETICAKVVVHYAQLAESYKFRNYDYGHYTNIERYNQSTPPVYNISKIVIPTTLYVANNDYFSSVKDVQNAYSQLRNDYKCGLTVLDYKKFNHIDFIQARDVNQILYNELLAKVKKVANDQC